MRMYKDLPLTFEGKTYYGQTAWEPMEGYVNSYQIYAIAAEDAKADSEGFIRAVILEGLVIKRGIEVSPRDMFEVVGVQGPELEDENGGVYATLLWSEKTGFVEEYLNGEKRKVEMIDHSLETRKRWIETLKREPESAKECPWKIFMNEDWGEILAISPDYLVHCPWQRFSHDEWASVVMDTSRLDDKCPWDELDGYDWSEVLESRPELITRCKINQLKIEDRVYLACRRKEIRIEDYVKWEELSSHNWGDLIAERPEYAEKCPWPTLEGKDIVKIYESQPQFIPIHGFDRFTMLDWAKFLSLNKDYDAKCPYWDEFSGAALPYVLEGHPELIDKYDVSMLSGEDWEHLLLCHPEFADRCNWDHFNGRDWYYILRYCPEYSDRCDWNKLTEQDWEDILLFHPEFEDFMPRA